MFVRRSTYDAVVAQRDNAESRLLAQKQEIEGLGRRHEKLRQDANEALAGAEAEISSMRAELAQSWFRDRKGHFQRHPTNIAPLRRGK